MVVGLLIQALQFSGLYTALKLGVPAGESALIVGTMPVFTALGAGAYAAAVVALPPALHLEGFAVQWTPPFVFASSWLSIVNSIGATRLLFILMRKGEAGKVASLFYLSPGVTALMAFAVLGETLGPLSLAGYAATAGAVWLCTRSR